MSTDTTNREDPPVTDQSTHPLTDEETAYCECSAMRAIVEHHLRPMSAELDRLRAENTALRASLDQFNSFPDNPGPGNWSTSYRMGYADAGKDVRALARALGLDQDGEGQANG